MTKKFQFYIDTKGIKNSCSYINFYTNAHSSIIHNSQDMEATWVSINRWMDKEGIVKKKKKEGIVYLCTIEY